MPVTCLALMRAVVFMLWTLDLCGGSWAASWRGVLVNKGNPTPGDGVWGCWGKGCRTTWSGRAETVILPWEEGTTLGSGEWVPTGLHCLCCCCSFSQSVAPGVCCGAESELGCFYGALNRKKPKVTVVTGSQSE